MQCHYTARQPTIMNCHFTLGFSCLSLWGVGLPSCSCCLCCDWLGLTQALRVAGAPPITGRRRGQAPLPHTSPLNISMFQVGADMVCVLVSCRRVECSLVTSVSSPFLMLF